MHHAGSPGRQVISPDQRKTADLIPVHPADKGKLVAVPDVCPSPHFFGNHDLPAAVNREHGLNPAC